MDRDQDASRYPVPERVILTAQLGLDRQSYEALEQAVIDTLRGESYPFTERVLASFVLVDAAVIEYGRGSKSTSAFSTWLGEMLGPMRHDWVIKEAAGKAAKAVNPGSQRRVLASIICTQEGRLGREIGGRNPGGLGCSLAVAQGRGRLFLPSLGAEVKLEEMDRVEVDQDLIRSANVLVDYLVDCVRRGLLVRHSSVLRGVRFLLVRLALVRWYASAVATLRGLSKVGEEEIREAVAVVARSYPLDGATGPASEDARYGLPARTLVDLSLAENLALPIPPRR